MARPTGKGRPTSPGKSGTKTNHGSVVSALARSLSGKPADGATPGDRGSQISALAKTNSTSTSGSDDTDSTSTSSTTTPDLSTADGYYNHMAQHGKG